MTEPRTSSRSSLVALRGGEFTMGSDRFYPEERPAHRQTVEPFEISSTLVTNTQFAEFVAATSYTTTAEQPLDPALYPGADPTLLVPGGLVFHKTPGPVRLDDFSQWWAYEPGASWRHPTGPASTIDGLDNHPVVQVSYPDANAYADWRGLRLPTENEWEHAARGGLDTADFVWGDVETPQGVPLANTWQGPFPWQNTAADGYEATSPVGAYAPNGYGLFDMAGNVWEWTSTWWGAHEPPISSCCAPSRTDHEREHSSAATGEPFGRRIIKGGSHLCAPEYCLRYRPAARQPEAVDTSTCHIGFRCATS